MKRIGSGRTADIFELDGNRVLKLYKPGVSKAAIEREREVSIVASEASLPTPRCHGDHTLDGRDGLVFDRVKGPSMLALFSRAPWRVLELSAAFADLHARIHAVRYRRVPSFKAELAGRLAAASGPAERHRDDALAALAGLEDGESLLHGDFHPDNIVMTEGGPVIIDWMTGASGPAEADVTRSAIIIGGGALPPGQRLPMRLLTRFGRSASLAAYLRRYRRQNTLAESTLSGWRLPLLVARLALGLPGEAPALEAEIRKLMH